MSEQIDIEALKELSHELRMTSSTMEYGADEYLLLRAAAAIEQLQAENAELQQAKRNTCSMLDRALEQNEGLKAESVRLRSKLQANDN